MFVNIYWKRMLVWSGQNVIEGRIPLTDFGTVDKTIYNIIIWEEAFVTV